MNHRDIVKLATEAATAAGDVWMATATTKYLVTEGDLFTGKPVPGAPVYGMLDLCGNAHVQFKDKRSKIYKDFVKQGLVRSTGNAVVEIEHKWKRRQEHGLQMVCAKAAMAKLEEHGVTGLHIWSYID